MVDLGKLSKDELQRLITFLDWKPSDKNTPEEIQEEMQWAKRLANKFRKRLRGSHNHYNQKKHKIATTPR